MALGLLFLLFGAVIVPCISGVNINQNTTGTLILRPNVNSIEYQNQKNIITSEIEAMDHPSFAKMVKRISRDEARTILHKLIQNPYDEDLCIALAIVFLFIFWIPVANFIIWFDAVMLQCPWAQNLVPGDYHNSEVPCSSCALEELSNLIKSHSQIND